MKTVRNIPAVDSMTSHATPPASTQPAPAPAPAPTPELADAAQTSLATHLCERLNINARALDLQRSLLPFAAACAPVIVTSVLAPAWLALIMAVPCAWALYRVAQSLQTSLFEGSASRGFAAYVMPMNLLLVLWGGALAATGQTGAVASTAFAWIALLCLSVAPACRWSRQRSSRRVPLRWSFPLAATLVVLAQSLAVLDQQGWLKSAFWRAS